MSRVIVVMGVSGCGKSSVGREIGLELGGDFLEADDLHPASNIAKMASGTPLTDEDRWPWLKAVASETESRIQDNDYCVVACSALRKTYREKLREIHADVYFVFLDGTRELILNRMKARTDHFMPTKLLDSQFAALEVPVDESDVVRVSVADSTSEICWSAIKQLNLLFEKTENNSH